MRCSSGRSTGSMTTNQSAGAARRRALFAYACLASCTWGMAPIFNVQEHACVHHKCNDHSKSGICKAAKYLPGCSSGDHTCGKSVPRLPSSSPLYHTDAAQECALRCRDAASRDSSYSKLGFWIVASGGHCGCSRDSCGEGKVQHRHW